MDIYRGQIYFVGLISERCIETKVRPVVIVSNNVGNKYSEFVLVVPITSNTSREDAPTHVRVLNGRIDGVVLCEQITPCMKSRLGDCVGCLSPYQLQKLDSALANVLDLTGKFSNSAPDVARQALDEQEKVVKNLQEQLDRHIQVLNNMKGTSVESPTKSAVGSTKTRTYTKRSPQDIIAFIMEWESGKDKKTVAAHYGFSNTATATTFYTRHKGDLAC